ncbi:MAG: dephospho-CoA kinase [Bryobacterales bacterium]|nr:dephospho-CoA kinase [Opitutaceae bacterium]MCZ2154067.1 dephospho-CoA kinase [Bryobacterales bacterium]
MVIGVTGGMGCGKSTVARLMEGRGLARLDSDEVIRSQLLVNEQILDSLVCYFGSMVLSEDRAVRRSYLALRIFENDADRQWLEELLLPKLFSIWRKMLREDRTRDWVFEVPLLFEKQLENWFDFTLCVSSTPENQLIRLEKRGMTRAHAELRISKQLPLARKVELADFVIGNDGTSDFLRLQVDALVGQLGIRV